MSIVLFFTVIALATGLYVPGIIGAILCAAHPLLAYAMSRRTRGASDHHAMASASIP